MGKVPTFPKSLSPLIASEHPGSVAYRITLSPHEWTWTQAEQEAMAATIVELDKYRSKLEKALEPLNVVLHHL